MTDQNEHRDVADVEQINAELTRSLDRCRKLLFDFRSDVAANSNMPELLDGNTEETCG